MAAKYDQISHTRFTNPPKIDKWIKKGLPTSIDLFCLEIGKEIRMLLIATNS